MVFTAILGGDIPWGKHKGEDAIQELECTTRADINPQATKVT
jgi:hypothetical protein